MLLESVKAKDSTLYALGVVPEALETFWYWCNERHSIYLNRIVGKPKPWSEDEIFQSWKFCNVFRQLDKTTQWMMKNIVEPHTTPGDSIDLLIFNIFLFRAFNWPDTYAQIGWQNNWDEKDVQDKLGQYVNDGGKLLSSAYIITGRAGKTKWRSIPEALSSVWRDRGKLMEVIWTQNSLQKSLDIIVDGDYYGWGPFTTYQVLLDLTYTPILNEAKDLNTWCSFGPGARRGLERLWPELNTNPSNDKGCIEACVQLLEMQDQYRDEHLPVMNLQDIEFSLCEFDKYSRIKEGGRMKERYAGRE